MTSPCDKVELFVDGELPEEDAETFRQHLPDCMKCQQAMDRLMQLDFLGSSHVLAEQAQEKATARVFFLPRWRLPAMVATAALAAALVLLVLRQPGKPSIQGDVWLAQRPQRLLEARVSYPAADRYREPAARQMGGSDNAPDELSYKHDRLSYADLAELEQSDPHGMAAAFLVRDDKSLAKQALRELEKLGRSPDLDSDRAVAKLLEGESEAALELLDAALAENPRHPQALWNRGLVLRELGLPLEAARAFSEVAALKEPGWSEEAAEKAEALQRPVSARRERWTAVQEAGTALRHAAPGNLPEGFSELPSARRLFYEAVRTAPSRDRVLLLLPIAQKLDERAGGSVLESYVRRVAEADFSRRAPLAQRYGELLENRLSAEEKKQLLAALLESKEEDIFLGAHAAMDGAELKIYEERAAASGDPWFQLLAAQRRALADASTGDWKGAVQKMSDAMQLCKGAGLEYRCIVLEAELSSLYSSHHDKLDLARTHAENGWTKAHELGEWQLESNLLWSLAEIARLSEDTSLTRVYFGEFATREKGNPDAARRAHQALAALAMQELRVDDARQEIDAALATGVPLGLPGVFALAEISRLKSAPGDEENLVKAVERVALDQRGPGGRLITTHVLGRFFIERDEQKGRALLWRVIEQAEAPELVGDDAAQRARAYSFTTLLLTAGQRKDFQEGMKLLERERGMEPPRRCLLMATVDSGRVLFLARGSDGALMGHYEERRQPQPKERLDGWVPEALMAPLRQCEQVKVLARPPLRDRPGLLPPELAWSYLTRTSAERRVPPTGPSIHLVVSDVALPTEGDLKRLNPWTPSFGPGERAVTLSGAEATPSRVLAAMRDATEIDLVTHGVLDDRAGASYLLLAPGPGGSKLDVTQVRKASLQGAPFVVLAACHAAHATVSVDVPLSLPAAFIQAGARGVLAATVEIPDLEAQSFFNAVRERMRSGAAPALALRDERMRWLGEGRGATWIENVLLLE